MLFPAEIAASRSPELLLAEQSLGLIVDVQAKLLPLIPGFAKIEWNLTRLLRGFAALQVPTLATEQYPQGLGPTVTSVRQALSAAWRVPSTSNPIEDNPSGSASTTEPSFPAKLSFSCCGSAEFLAQLAAWNRTAVIVAGIETHVCVLQTVLDLLARGLRVQVVVDATGSRHEVDQQTALRRLEANGAVLTTTETALFELCERAGSAVFKTLSQLVQEKGPV